MDILLNVQGQTLTRTDTTPIIGDSKNFLYALFSFSAEWAGLIKTVQFRKNKTSYDCVVGPDNRVLVPWEVLVDSGLVAVSVFAGDRITTNAVDLRVQPSGMRSDGLPSEPTPGYFDQVVKLLAGKGPKGDPGEKGDPGTSAFAEAVAGGYSGTESQFQTDLAAISGLAAAIDAIVGV